MNKPWHPSENELSAFLECQKTSPELENHLNECDFCKQLLIQLQQQLQRERIAPPVAIERESHKLSVMRHAIRESAKLNTNARDLQEETKSNPTAQWGFFASLGAAYGAFVSDTFQSPAPALGGNMQTETPMGTGADAGDDEATSEPNTTSADDSFDTSSTQTPGPLLDTFSIDVIGTNEDLSISATPEVEEALDAPNEEDSDDLYAS